MRILLECWESPSDLSSEETKVYFVESQTYEMLANFVADGAVPHDVELAGQLERLGKTLGLTFNDRRHRAETAGHWLRAYGRADDQTAVWSCTLY
jgi:hypothetical protein